MKFKNSTHLRKAINGAKFKFKTVEQKSESIDNELKRMEETMKRIKDRIPAGVVMMLNQHIQTLKYHNSGG